jgi:DNA-binding CsgD family transcriptional regulator
MTTFDDPAGARGPLQSRFGAQAARRLSAGFSRSKHPMFIADDLRRWVVGNAAAGELLGIATEEIPWRTMDEFTPPRQREDLARGWSEFLATGEAEGGYQLYFPDREMMPVEFSATAHVFPSRHLAVFMGVADPEDEHMHASSAAPVPSWSPVAAVDVRGPLTAREREIITLVASGCLTAEIAERLVISPETVKSHVQNVMSKLCARTRSHAVAIALVTGQIAWEA